MQKYRDYRMAIEKTLAMIQPTDDGLAGGAVTIQEILKLAASETQPEQTENKEDTHSEAPTQSRPEPTVKNEATSNTEQPATEKTNTELPTTEKSATEEPTTEKTTTELVTQSTKPSPDEPNHTVMQVRRRLKGFDLIDPDNDKAPHYYYDEILARQLEIQNGDWVQVGTMQRGKNHPYIEKILSHAEVPNLITVAPLYVVNYNSFDDTYQITQNYQGTPLASVNPAVETFKISGRDALRQRINDGQLVDLAWFNEQPDKPVVRYVHHSHRPLGAQANRPEKRVKSTTSTSPAEPIQTLDFDLKAQTVAVVMGDANTRQQQITQLIDEHNGHALLIDAFKHSNSASFYNQQLSQTDIVVMVQNQNKHATSKALSKAVKQYDLKMAIANGGAYNKSNGRCIVPLKAYQLLKVAI
ncbi:hypothetical protein [Lactiplantibacillus pentosus]|uniref:hypothetical protein n=1 Tax=Lactiplantibacillus pentosus TaxID=1589 RepID=UPI0021A34F56|nr:hypothetical protein [Lactiplantibacillus pentosus]